MVPQSTPPKESLELFTLFGNYSKFTKVARIVHRIFVHYLPSLVNLLVFATFEFSIYLPIYYTHTYYLS